MDTRHHLKQLARFLMRNFYITEETIPTIFDDYMQDYLTEEILRYIDDREIEDRLRKGDKK